MMCCLAPTWSSLQVCRRRCLKKSKREHFRTRMRSVVPSARWAAGERPSGLRGQAQLIPAAFIARNFPRIVLHSPSLSEDRKTLWRLMTYNNIVKNFLTDDLWFWKCVNLTALELKIRVSRPTAVLTHHCLMLHPSHTSRLSLKVAARCADTPHS